MKLFKLSLLLTALLALCTAAHAEVVGRVLMAAGDVSVIRDNRVLRVAVGTPVEDKDTLKTGPASNMQVRFTDESIVSLRDQSLLKIDEYKFTGKQDGMEKAFFNLLKGGFRTITGVIGRVNKTSYGVKTATATIGIRGTNFALLLCTAGSCGAAAKDGLYGGVSGGIIAAINNTGEYQFGSGDYFYAPSQDTPVKKLIGPPGFFADHLSGQGHAVGRQAFTAGAGNVQTQNGGAASDSSPNSVVQPPPQQAFIVTENLGLNGAPSVLGSLLATSGSFTYSTTISFTGPTSTLGTGTFGSATALVDLGSRTVSISSLIFDCCVTSMGTYNLSSPTPARFSSSSPTGSGSLGGSCVGSCGTVSPAPATGSFNFTLAGAPVPSSVNLGYTATSPPLPQVSGTVSLKQ